MTFSEVYVNVLHGDGTTTSEYRFHRNVRAVDLGTLCVDALDAARAEFPVVDGSPVQLDLTLVAP